MVSLLSNLVPHEIQTTAFEFLLVNSEIIQPTSASIELLGDQQLKTAMGGKLPCGPVSHSISVKTEKQEKGKPSRLQCNLKKTGYQRGKMGALNSEQSFNNDV